MQVAALLWFGGVLSLSLLWPVLSVPLRTLCCSLLLAILPRLARTGRPSASQAPDIKYQAAVSPTTRMQIAVSGCLGSESSKTDEAAPAKLDANLRRWCRSHLGVQALQGNCSVILCPPRVAAACKRRAAQVILGSIKSSGCSVPELQVLLQDDAEAALWAQEATRLLGPSEPISPAGTPLDEWQTVEPADWEDAAHAIMPQETSTSVKADAATRLKAESEE